VNKQKSNERQEANKISAVVLRKSLAKSTVGKATTAVTSPS